MWRHTGGFLLASVALLTGCGAGSTPPEAQMRSSPSTATTMLSPSSVATRPTVPEAVPAEGDIGVPVTVAGITLTVDSVVFDTCNGDAPPGKTVAEVAVTVTNDSEENARYGALDWTLTTTDGTFTPEFGDCIPTEENPPLSPGITVSRTLSFVVPPDVAGLELVYQPGVSPSGTSITVDLGI